MSTGSSEKYGRRSWAGKPSVMLRICDSSDKHCEIAFMMVWAVSSKRQMCKKGYKLEWLCSNIRQRPYHVESTGSRPITEVKQRRARLVLGWVTAWEPRVLLASHFCILLFIYYGNTASTVTGTTHCTKFPSYMGITNTISFFLQSNTLLVQSLHTQILSLLT